MIHRRFNRVSGECSAFFILEQRDELLASGALVPWTATSKPHTVHDLGGAKHDKGMKRFISDCRYLNLFLPYQHFKREQLCDAMQCLQLHDWCVLSDAKSGHHRVPMRQDTWTYLAEESSVSAACWHSPAVWPCSRLQDLHRCDG